MPPGARRIIEEVCRKRQICQRDLLGKFHDQNLVEARKEAARRMREECSYSLPKIGTVLNRDHSTIVHYLKTGERPWQSK